MYREVINRLCQWKDSSRRKPLIITGVRQCGKTYIIEQFGKKEFENFVEVNFERQEEASSIFEYNLDTDRIIRELEDLSGQKIVPGKTLLFFDEIQACPRALTSLKYFCEEKKDLALICAGSLLGVALTHQDISFPVGKVNRLTLYPMDFREFVLARGREDLIRTFTSWPMDRKIPELYSAPMTKLLKEYWVVGGMPEAVQTFLDTEDFRAVEEVQEEIIEDYEDDFAKHGPVSELMNIRMIWQSVPKQLARENNKFIFSHVKSGKRAADLENALQWLCDAGLIYKLKLVRNPEVPLSAFADETYFKVYLSDVGLLGRRARLSPEAVLNGSGRFVEFKGAFAENYVMCELKAKGKGPYFWRSGNTAELDFMYDGEDSVVPVEVKAADNVQAKSYRQFIRKYRPETGYKLSLKNLGVNQSEGTETLNLPLYLAWKIQ